MSVTRRLVAIFVADVGVQSICYRRGDVSTWPILLQKSFCIIEHKFSVPWARHSKSHVGDHIIVSETLRRLR